MMMANVIDLVVGGEWLVRSWVVVLDAGLRGAVLLGLVLSSAAVLRGASAAMRHALVGAGLLMMLVMPLGALLPWQLPLLPAGLPGGAISGPVGDTGPGALSAEATDRRTLGAALRRELAGLYGSEVRPDQNRGGVPALSDPRGANEGETGGESVTESDPPATASAGRGEFGTSEQAAGEQRVPGAAVTTGGRAASLDPARQLLFGLMAVWLVGVFLLSARMLVGHWRASRLVRTAGGVHDPSWTDVLWESADRLDIESDVRLLRSSGVEIPLTAGVIRPAILLPAGADEWEDERRRAVLLHELAHIRRHDLLLHHVSRWACALYWFNPLVWLGAKRLRAESEKAADDLVLSAGTRPSAYASHLLQIVASVGHTGTPGALLPLARRRDFEGRLLAILEPRLRRTEPNRLQVAALTLGIALVALPLAALAPVSAADPLGSLADAAGLADEPPDAPSAASTASSEEQPGTASGADSDAEAEAMGLPGSERRSPPPVGSPSPSVDTWTWPHVKPSTQPTPPPRSAGSRVDIDPPIIIGGPGRDVAISDREIVAYEGLIGNGNPEYIDVDTRLAVVQALGDADPDPRVIAALIRALQTDPAPGVRCAAARGLAELEATDAIDALAAALVGDTDADVRGTAAWALGEIEDERAADALVTALGDADEGVRRASLHALGEIDFVGAAPGLIRALSDPDPELRRTAAWSLGELDLVAAPPELMAALSDEDPQVRRVAARALEEIEDPAAADALVAALDDDDSGVRRAAIRALAELDVLAVAPGLLSALADPDPSIRLTAARTLGDLDLDAAPPELVDALFDEDPQVRRAAARALEEIEDPAAADALRRALADTAEEVRHAVLRALVELGSPVAIDALVAALDDDDPVVRLMAAEALGDL